MGDEDSGIHCRLDELLEAHGMTLTRLSELVGVSIVNLSVLKNDRARAIRYSTLSAICAALDCTIGDLLVRVEGSRHPPAADWSAGRQASRVRGLVADDDAAASSATDGATVIAAVAAAASLSASKRARSSASISA